jgi:hypothetical protein
LSRPAITIAVLLALSAAAPSAHAGKVLMPDSTTAEDFRLANGLEVRVRSIPGAVGASVSLAYRAGNLHLPPGNTGLAQLLAELQFTAAAGSVPERTREELSSLRPAGWDVRTNDHVAVLTEMAAPSQLPGVLLQVAARAHGVQVSPACFQRASGTVRSTLAREALGDPNMMLYRRVRDVALGRDDASIFADAQGKGLEGINAGAATGWLQRLYVPANATLALAGDMGGIDVHAVIEKLFADIPAGKPEPEAASPRLRPGARALEFAGLDKSLGVVAAIAPALDDSTHAPFYLAGLLAGAWWREQVGAPQPPLTSVFRYSVLDEPDLARFYVESTAALADTANLVNHWGDAVEALRGQLIPEPLLGQVRTSVEWLVGGPISSPVLKLMRRESSALSELSASMATRACWRGDRFWARWRHQFETSRLSPQMFFSYMLAPGHHVAVVVAPRR